MYVTHEQLAERPGAKELAQVATDPQRPFVDPDLMEATLRNEDRSGWAPDEVAAADEALQRIDDAVADADGLIDGYLHKRGYPVPLDPVPRIVAAWSRDISRYYLHKDRRGGKDNDPIVRAYKDAMKLLEQLASGKFSLGADDDLVSEGAGSPAFVKGKTPLRNSFEDFDHL